MTVYDTHAATAQNESKKRKKIRYWDVWVPQVTMALMETVVNLV